MHQRRRRLVVTMGMLVAGAMLTSGSASGSTLEPDVEPVLATGGDVAFVERQALREDAMILARQLGTTHEQAYAYLVTQQEILAAAPAVAEAAGDALAGIWIDWQPEPVLVVLVTGTGVSRSLTEALSPISGSAEVRTGARYTRTGLLEALRQAAPALTDLAPDVTGSWLDEARNEVVIDLALSQRETAAARDEVRSTLLELDVPFRFEYDTSMSIDANRGGRHLTGCTSAFTVRHPATNTHGYLTAGHCGVPQYYMWWSDGSWWTKVQFVEQRWTAATDIEWHRIDPTMQPTSVFFHVSKTVARTQTGPGSAIPGTQVCSWGSRSLTQKCGGVTSITFAPTTGCGPNGVPCSNTYGRFSTGSAKSCRGDSGSPVYIGTTPIGVVKTMSGPEGPDKCNTGSNRFLTYTPISAAALMGVVIYTL